MPAHQGLYLRPHPNILLFPDVYQDMEIARMTQAGPDTGRRPGNGADADDDAPDQDAAPAAPLDLYAMLGYRPSFMSGATTQQWLAVRLIEL